MHVGKRHFSHFFSLTSMPHLYRAAHPPSPGALSPVPSAGWCLLCYSWRFSRLIASCHLLHFLTKHTDPYGILIAFAVHICFYETKLSICQSHCICLVSPFTILLFPNALLVFYFSCCLKLQAMRQHCHILDISSDTTGQQSVCLFVMTIPNGLKLQVQVRCFCSIST